MEILNSIYNYETLIYIIVFFSSLYMIKLLFNFYRELKEMLIIYKYKNQISYVKTLRENGYELDWIGRVYKTIEIPNEFINDVDEVKYYLFSQHKIISDICFSKYDIFQIIQFEYVFISDDKYAVIYSSKRIYLRLIYFMLLSLLLLLNTILIYSLY